MPVRETTQWRHAITQKKVINHDRGGTYVMCAWDTCERDGYEMHKAVEFEGWETIWHDGHRVRIPRYVTFVFCSDRHKQYFANSLRDLNNLPAGYKRSIV